VDDDDDSLDLGWHKAVAIGLLRLVVGKSQVVVEAGRVLDAEVDELRTRNARQ